VIGVSKNPTDWYSGCSSLRDPSWILIDNWWEAGRKGSLLEGSLEVEEQRKGWDKNTRAQATFADEPSHHKIKLPLIGEEAGR